jgi:hypothetical protein
MLVSDPQERETGRRAGRDDGLSVRTACSPSHGFQGAVAVEFDEAKRWLAGKCSSNYFKFAIAIARIKLATRNEAIATTNDTRTFDCQYDAFFSFPRALGLSVV